MAESKAVATKEDQKNQMPAFMQGDAPAAGSDNFDNDDVMIPRIKLMQGTSPEVEAYDNAKAGGFWHTGMDMPLGSSVRFIVADRRKKYLLAAPLEDGQGVLARADDAVTWNTTGKWQVKLKGVKQPVTWEIDTTDVAKSGLANWGTSNPDDEDSPPAATLFYDYLVFLPDYPELGPAVLSLARSQIKPAKRGLNDKIKLHMDNNRPMQGIIFIMESKDDVNEDSNTYKNYVFKAGGFVQDPDLYRMAREHIGALADVKIKDEVEGDDSPAPADDGEGNF